MSKSIGNVVDPQLMSQKYGVDQLRYFLLREVRFGEDGDFSEAQFKNRINFDLANDLGNLVQRVLKFPQKLGKFTPNYLFNAEQNALINEAHQLPNQLVGLFDKQDVSKALDLIWKLVSDCNKYVDSSKPWVLLKEGRLDEANACLTALIEAIRAIAICLSPYMPSTCAKIFKFLDTKGQNFDELKTRFEEKILPEPEALFPKNEN